MLEKEPDGAVDYLSPHCHATKISSFGCSAGSSKNTTAYTYGEVYTVETAYTCV